jgi:hypothetical protein
MTAGAPSPPPRAPWKALETSDLPGDLAGNGGCPLIHSGRKGAGPSCYNARMIRSPLIFERPSNLPPVDPVPLDAEILRQVRRHRFLRAGQVVRMLPREPEGRVLRRLVQLFEHGYLERPKAQLRYDSIPRSRDLVYALAKRGVRRLQSLGELDSHRVHEKRPGQLYLDHTLEVAEFMTRLERELPPGVSLSYLDDAPSVQRSVAGCSWSVPVSYRGECLRVGVVPDRVFRLSTRDEELLFCLEVDRGTMPVQRRNPAQSSFYRKLLAYHETWRSGLHVRELGWRRFRVLTLTSSAERRDHLVEVCKEVVAGGGSGLFMFADRESFAREASLPAMPWLTGDGTNLAKILSEARG